MNAQFGNGVEAGDSAVDNRRPPQPLVLYDGDCGFCARSVALTRGRWFRAGVAVEAFQRADLLVHNLTVDKCAEVLHVVDTDGVVHVGSDAVAVVLRESRLPWPAVGAVLRLPGVRRLAQLGYAAVAKRRHKLPGGSAACEL